MKDTLSLGRKKKMEIFGFNYKRKKISLEVKECANILDKALGLMFRTKSPSLLFIFKKPVKTPIHSFFCKPFVAIWFNKNKIIDVKLVKSWRFAIKPDQKFDALLEIPSNDKNFLIFYRRESRKL